jgi:sugar O-acyltransferase (sialic acid O-acetyltransferase NeuD family)
VGIYGYTFEMKKLIIFGNSEIAELAYHYFTSDSLYEVAGFTVDEEFKDTDYFLGKPLISFQNIRESFPPSDYDFFVALSYTKLNELRKAKYLAAKNLGYNLASYISSKATVLNDKNIGENCFILEDNTIQPKVIIGNNVTLWSGNHIGHHSVIQDNVFISSHVVVSGGVIVEDSSFIGVNATLRDHIVIGSKSVIGAGSIIMKSTDPLSVYVPKSTEKREVSSSQLRKI